MQAKNSVDIFLDPTVFHPQLLFVGSEDCLPSHCYGPHIREYYLLHYCVSGRGVLEDPYGTHPIGAGEVFLICPGEVTRYIADPAMPWSYVWMAFTCPDLPPHQPSVMQYPYASFLSVREFIRAEVTAPEIYLAALYEILYYLFLPNRTTPDLCGRLRRYIDLNYMQDLSVEQLADSCGFDRRYLSRIFKARCGKSLKQYLVSVRMEHAKEFLRSGYTVSQTALLCGYHDECNFSKMFKLECGVSPSNYRKRGQKQG